MRCAEGWLRVGALFFYRTIVMKRIIIFSLCQLLIFIAPLSQALAQEPVPPPAPIAKTYAEGLKDGKQCAHDCYKSGKWLTMGFAGGLLTGPFGTVIVSGVSVIGRPRLPVEQRMQIHNESLPYQDGFEKGYAKRAKSMALGQSLVGGAVGTGALIGMAALVGAMMALSFRHSFH